MGHNAAIERKLRTGAVRTLGMLASASMNCAGQATQAAPLATLPMDARNASTHRGSHCVPAPAARIDNQDERTQIQAQCREVQAGTGDNISLVYGVLGYNGKQAEQTAAAEGIELQVVSLPQTGKGQTGARAPSAGSCSCPGAGS